jgi:8-oxo-dGTP diphosphatase
MNEGRKRPIVIVAACALLDSEGAVLIAKRPAGRPLAGLWEFPGGKVEAGEEPEEALIRELHEELGIGSPRRSPPLTFATTHPDFHR